MTVTLHKSGRIEVEHSKINASFASIEKVLVHYRGKHVHLFVNEAPVIGIDGDFMNGLFYAAETEALADYNELCRILDAYHAGKAAPVVEKEEPKAEEWKPKVGDAAIAVDHRNSCIKDGTCVLIARYDHRDDELPYHIFSLGKDANSDWVPSRGIRPPETDDEKRKCNALKAAWDALQEDET